MKSFFKRFTFTWNAKLRTKLLSSFILICIIFSIGSVVSFTSMRNTNQSYDYLINNVMEIRSVSSSIESNISQQTSHFRGYFLNGDIEDLDRVTELSQIGSELINNGLELSTVEEVTDSLTILQNLNNSYSNQVEDITTNGMGSSDTSNRDLVLLENRMINESQQLNDLLNEIVAEHSEQTTAESATAMILILIISAVALVIAIVGGFIISTMISKPIVKLAQISERLADGDLTVDSLTVKSRDEIYVLNESFRNMTNNFRKMVAQIASNTDQVAASSEQLSSSADETTKATTTITGSIQSVATGAETQVQSTGAAKEVVKDIAVGMKQITESVELVSSFANDAGDKSNNGKVVIEKAMKQMDKINSKTAEISDVVQQLGDKSKEIGSIISLITDVAEQTNLLALNAAIEAARAGEHGRGFAVVADEVRKLAEQSNKSAEEIRHLIHYIQEDIDRSVTMMGEGRESVEGGLTLVNDAGNEFETISLSVNDLTTQIAQILRAVKENTEGTNKMQTFIEEAAKIAEESASYSQNVAASTEEQMASMEEISASAETLSSMAEELLNEVRKFKV
ncbi:methyl-accepting chemotaxis protein [Evansella cellulosilytica]|uniref:Methyl-accepting chemotaxis sensory transducer n=1 Tax=Evansella cellulosilytica (strain ATCC 21833 / DSM 2522 / FERM P-1141 / JCM 9156 / N-4) TaxID=649639 RepID=E6TR89_EVAC2|nr:methyl-accepting chemotaxis protein [Evansella cellulosilytica]ADU30601.1 methyl-accepting chemotaxis sensory transducer [Evansella cellulosilytica DSM 2522]